MREGQAQRPAARLAVGVLELDALERRRRLDRIGGVAARQARLERARERDHLERRSRRLQARERDAGEPEDLARLRAQHRDAAELRAERLDRRALHAGSIVVRTAVPARGCGPRARASPARRTPPGRPATSSSKTRSRPEMPTVASSGMPRARASSTRAAGTGPSWPAIAVATGPSGDVRSAPSASGVPSRARMLARGGSVVLRVRRSPRLTPGNVRFSRPVDAGVVVLALEAHAQRRADRAEDARRDGHRHGHDRRPRACRPCPAGTRSRSLSRSRRGSRRRSPRAVWPCAPRPSARRASRGSRHAPTRRRSAPRAPRRRGARRRPSSRIRRSRGATPTPATKVRRRRARDRRRCDEAITMADNYGCPADTTRAASVR